jgi:hypothetical protein
MRIIKTTLVAARLVGIAVLLGCMILHMKAGRQVASDLLIGTASGAVCLITGLLFIGDTFRKGGSDVLGSLLISFVFGTGIFAMGFVYLSAGGLLPESFLPWAAGVFLAWFALFAIIFWIAMSSDRPEAGKAPAGVEVGKARGTGDTEEQPTASPRQAANGWTTAQLAFVLMLFGVITTLFAIKCLLFGPPPYSPLAYVIGPVLIVVGYLVDPHAIRNLRNECRNPPGPPAAAGR